MEEGREREEGMEGERKRRIKGGKKGGSAEEREKGREEGRDGGRAFVHLWCGTT